jgi:hypothetical protein
MKILFIFNFIITILIILYSCTYQKKVEDKGIISIDIGGQIDVFEESMLSSYSDDVSYIPLSNENGCLIREIHNIDFFEDKILISDMKNCFLFNSQGKLISKIGNVGNGPEEHKFVNACKIANNKYIYIQDDNYIKCYNYKGNFISKYKLQKQKGDEGVIRSWQLINDTIIIAKIPNYSGKSPYCARVFSLSGKTLKERRNFSFFNRKENYITDTDAKASIYYYRNNWYFKEMLNDTIFYVSPDFKFSPAYILDIGKYRISEAYNELDFMERMKTFNDYVFIHEVFETDKNLFFNISMGKHSPIFV